jgi:CheY-like chemotaxis protein
LELFRAKPDDFDLVVTDMTMPNMTGDQLATELMKIRPDVLVILCTGYSNKISDQSAQAIGIKALIYKPIVKADLAKTMRKVLDEART